MYTLIKQSAPGWEKKFVSESEAKEELYKWVCIGCLKDIRFEQETGESSLFGEKGRQAEYWDSLQPAQLHECGINDLLGTSCGCEFYYEEGGLHVHEDFHQLKAEYK